MMKSPARTVLIPAARVDLCLAFANTQSWRGRATPVESLSGFADLLAWLGDTAGFAPEALHPVADWARRDADGAAALLAEAIATRETIYRIFSALAGGEAVRDPDFAAIDRALTAAPSRSRLARLPTATWGDGPQPAGGRRVGDSVPIPGTGEIAERTQPPNVGARSAAEPASAAARHVRADERYAWRITGGAPTAPALLAPVLWSAGDLMAGADHARIRRCGNDKCLWLFMDASKGGTRRWCDMASCGNRAKAQRHYLKSRQS
jgi:predicted RNA-binding Zn ribbon-like protein